MDFIEALAFAALASVETGPYPEPFLNLPGPVL
jgi:hypothetical protein